MIKYKAVFFDFDYTLADSSKAVIECINYALQKNGLSRIFSGKYLQNNRTYVGRGF